MTAEVYTYIGAGGKTTSIFARPAGTGCRAPRGRRDDDPYEAPQPMVRTGRFAGRLAGPMAARRHHRRRPGRAERENHLARRGCLPAFMCGCRRRPRRRRWLTAPALEGHGPHEPVIPANSRDVYCLAGLSAVGQIVKDVCFRWELLHLNPEAVVTERLLAYIVEAGCLARIGSWKDRTTVVSTRPTMNGGSRRGNGF